MSTQRSRHARSLVGVDTGGTFTDLVAVDPEGGIRVDKVPSTPGDPSGAPLEGLGRLGLDKKPRLEVVHGTTVALNALLTGGVARTALVTNRGFRDLIEIGRQDRSDIYALHPRRPDPLIPRELRFEIGQRSWPSPTAADELIEVERPEAADLEKLVRAVRRSGAESVAICLLHAYRDPEIERRIATALEPLGLPVTCSASLLPAYREYERYSTAVLNACVSPVMAAYLARLDAELGGARVSLLQSSGGTIPAAAAAAEPARVLFSGPAGGVVGAARAATECGLGAIVTLDMGGTSTDVAFHEGDGHGAEAVSDATVAGHPLALPGLDLHTIGCGGGSLVTVDAGGVLHVGPESAGADPGPVAYGSGEQPTVTDAHVLLGHIAAEGFLGGELPLDVDAVARSFERLGRSLGVRPVDAAQGVLDVARAAMRRALGVMTMQRGIDPGTLPLVAFGGGGGLHAAALSSSLDMPGALVPTLPGVLSAHGMAHADALRDHSRSMLAPLSSWKKGERRAIARELAQQGKDELRQAGFAAGAIQHHAILELRYRGQSFELAVPEGVDPAGRFAERHRTRYGWDLEESSAAAEVELVAIRVRSLVTADAPRVGRNPRARQVPDSARVGRRRAWFGGWKNVQRFDRERLPLGCVVEGPAIIEEFSGTTLVPPGCTARVRQGRHLWLTS